MNFPVGTKTHLDARVVRQRVLSQLSSDTGRFEASERDGGMELVVAIDPDGSGVDLVGDGNGSRDVSREDGRGETILGLVGEGDDLGEDRREEASARRRRVERERGESRERQTSASSLNLVTTTTGPKISSLKMVWSEWTSEKTVCQSGGKGRRAQG